MNKKISQTQPVRNPDQETTEQAATNPKQTEKVNKNIPYPKRAQQLFEKGFEPIPVTPGEKFWDKTKWQTIELPIDPWPRNHGISLRTGSTCIGIDIDIYDAGIVQYLLESFDVQIITRVGQAPKVLVPVLCPEISGKLLSDSYVDDNGQPHRIEVLAQGQQFVAFAIHPGTKKPYQWSDDLLSHSLPVVSKDFILHLFDLFYELACAKKWKNISRRVKIAKKVVGIRKSTDDGNMPGDIYNRAVPVSVVLKHYGWTHYHGDYWTRPGKKRGVSGTVFDDRIFWPFTSSTILEPDRAYDSFELLTQYEFGGDKMACARALREEIK